MHDPTLAYRVFEVHTILPVLHLPVGPFTALVAGALAKRFALELLRWPDAAAVYCPPEHAPEKIDRRVRIGLPTNGACAVVCTSPNQTDALSYLRFLNKNGIFCASTEEAHAASFYAAVRATKLPYIPWREHTPLPLYGCLIALESKPVRRREPPKAAKRITANFLPSLFTFGKDEIAVIFHANHQLPPRPKLPS